MSELREITIGSHFKLTCGFPFASANFSNEGFPLIRIRDVLTSRTETYFQGSFPPGYIIKNGDILVGMDGDFHVVRWRGCDALLNQRVLKIDVLDETVVVLDYLYHWLGPFIKKINDVTAATTVKHLSTKDLTKAKANFPPVAMQRRIAAILNSIDKSIEKTEALIAKYQQIKAGLMHDLFSRGVTTDGKLRPPREQAPELYQETQIGWVPKEWSVNLLRGLVGAGNIINGPFGSDLLTSELKVDGVPVLYVQDIKPGYFKRVSNAHVTELKASELAFCNVRQGDVLVAKVGAPPCDSCVYPFAEKAIVTQDVIRIRPTPNVDSVYLSSLLNSPFGRKALKKIAIEGTRERVSLTEFKHLAFPIADAHEQVRIAERLTVTQTLIEKEIRNRGKLRQQKLGLMPDLLTGRIRVKVT